MASVSQLGYVGVGTSDGKAWQHLATNILGMQVVPGDDRSTSYLRMDEYHHRLELRSGGRVWDREIASQHMPWVAGDYVYILTTSGDVLCMTRRDGRIRWVQTLPRYENPEKEKDPITWSGPVLAGDRLIVVGSSGDAIALSPYTGQAMGRLELKGKTLISPVVADDTLLILTDDGDLVAYR